MRIIFAGTSDFANTVLEKLIRTKNKIVAVYCQQDRKKGRGQIITSCITKKTAIENNIKVYQPDDLKIIEVENQIISLKPDVIVVVAYGKIIPKNILKIAKYGCLNIHASLLPKWRGAAPIQRSILAGDTKTGISIIKINERLDGGDILLKKEFKINDDDNAKILHDKLAVLGADTIIEVLDNIESFKPVKQDEKLASYAKKLKKDEAWINWGQSAFKINCQIRAFNPYPVAQTMVSSDKFSNQILRIFKAKIIKNKDNTKPFGHIIKYGKGLCYIQTGDGIISLEKIQLANKNITDIKDFTNAYKLTRVN
jgi:methionyl-tRNA formyltransferase